MGKRLKQLWTARPRMSREAKTVRNLLIIVLAALAFWWTSRCPVLTAQGAVDRLSRQLMLPEGEIVEREDCWALVKGENYAYVTKLYYSIWSGVDTSFTEGTELGGEYALLRCPTERTWGAFLQEGNNTRTMICPEGPEMAQRCTVEIQQTYWEDDALRELRYELEGAREKSGTYLLKWECQREEDWNGSRLLWEQRGVSEDDGADYVLRFYDGQGNLLESQEGAFTYRW